MKATAEQKQKAEARRSAMRALANQIGKMGEAERAAFAAKCPVVTIEGRALSFFNQCMIAFQGGATVVGGFRQWLKAGRVVRKGEHGKCIWIPIGHKATTEDGTEETLSVDYFTLATVFDVTQTEAKTETSAPQLAAA